MVLYLLATVAALGAADTIYYHEWRAKLPGMGKAARDEFLVPSPFLLSCDRF